MAAAQSVLDRPAARVVAGLVALLALGLLGWLVYIDNRQDPALAACIKERSAAIAAAREKGALDASIAERFLARVAASCEAQLREGGGAGALPPLR